MYTLQLRNGDFVLGSGGFQTITGASKVVQDLRCALVEPVGNDRFHPGYGSLLQDFIGEPLDEILAFSVQQEVARVVQNYSAVQRDQIEADVLSGLASRYNSADVIANLSDIKSTLVGDRLYVQVALTTLDAQSLVLTTNVGV